MWKIDSSREKYARFIALALLPLIVAALFVLGSLPFVAVFFPVPYDKLAHLLLFAILSVLFGAASGLLPLPRAGVLLAALCSALAVGAADELHQAFVPGRSAGWDDFAFDFAGTLYGLWVLVRLGLAR